MAHTEFCGEKGDLLQNELIKIQAKYPELILEVRGRGLMQGFVIDNTLSEKVSEFTDIAYINLVEGYLFKHGYRVGTTLTSGAVIRLEPSVFITESQIKDFIVVLSKLGQVIQNGEFQRLVKEVTEYE